MHVSSGHELAYVRYLEAHNLSVKERRESRGEVDSRLCDSKRALDLEQRADQLALACVYLDGLVGRLEDGEVEALSCHLLVEGVRLVEGLESILRIGILL